MELVNGHEPFLALSNRGALSFLDAGFKFARASYSVAGEPWSTVRMEEHSGRFSVSSAAIGGCAGLICACVRMRSEAGRISVQTGSRRRSRSIRARSCVLRSIASDVGVENSSSDENDVSLARRERRTSLRCRCNFGIPRHGNWPRTVVSSARKTSKFLRHVPSCIPSCTRRADLRDAF